MSTSYKILYVASEVSPFAKTGGLADVASALPRALKDSGHDVRIFMPKYGRIGDEKYTLRDVIRLRDIEVPHINQLTKVNVNVSSLPESKVQVYFLDYPPYFDREELYVNPKTGLDYDDNAARFSLFARAALQMLRTLHWKPDIIHCNDWQSGLIPIYLKTFYSEDSFLRNCRTLLTVHNFAYNGSFDRQMLKVTDLNYDFNKEDGPLDFFGRISYLKAGLTTADFINTVSKTYAKEARELSDIGCGMEGVLQKRSKEFIGILNGVDYDDWNPAVDRLISANYDIDSFEKKAENKKILSQLVGLPFDANVPIIGSVSRLVEQKGFDLVEDAIPRLVQLGVQFVVLGRGEQRFERALKKLQMRYPAQVRAILEFSNSLAHQIEAGTDMFLMPSRYEPCGLNQLYSLKYGTLPIVRKTGGLADTVVDFNEKTGRGTGFVFDEYRVDHLINAVKRAVNAFKNKTAWQRLAVRAMKQNFSWENAQRKYSLLYERVLKRK